VFLLFDHVSANCLRIGVSKENGKWRLAREGVQMDDRALKIPGWCRQCFPSEYVLTSPCSNFSSESFSSNAMQEIVNCVAGDKISSHMVILRA
jgi:hypothetical protein